MEILDQNRFVSLAMDNVDIKEIKLIGAITGETIFYLHLYDFDVVDISEAEFIEEDKEEYVCYGFSHSGPVYGNKKVLRHYDYLAMFAEDVYARRIIVPPTLKRKHMNRLVAKDFIEQIIVPEDCQLFSMKDGNVYNKKGTSLVFKNKKRLSLRLRNSDSDKKVPVTFAYEGQLDFSIEGECTLEMTEQELAIFKQLTREAKENKADDILAYYADYGMPEELHNKIDIEILHEIKRQEALEVIEREDLDYFGDMSYEVFEAMTEEELIDRFMEECIDGIWDYLIEKIEIK